MAVSVSDALLQDVVPIKEIVTMADRRSGKFMGHMTISKGVKPLYFLYSGRGSINFYSFELINALATRRRKE